MPSLLRLLSSRTCVFVATSALSLLLVSCFGGGVKPVEPAPEPAPIMVPVAPKIGLVLGGGAARGFAHVGVIKMLESQGIAVDYIVGTSAGSVVGALYAAGHNGFELQEMTFDLDRSAFADWQWFGRGLIKGEALQNFINQKVGNRHIEQLPRRFACVATRLKTGEAMLFTQGDVGLAVRASSAIPGVFVSPVINGEEYVDGGTVSPVPVRYARQMGAELVIAVDISASVAMTPSDTTINTVLKTFAIMGNALKADELKEADVVITPNVGNIAAADFASKQRAILEGERSALAAIPQIKEAIMVKTRMVPAPPAVLVPTGLAPAN